MGMQISMSGKEDIVVKDLPKSCEWVHLHGTGYVGRRAGLGAHSRIKWLSLESFRSAPSCKLLS